MGTDRLQEFSSVSWATKVSSWPEMMFRQRAQRNQHEALGMAGKPALKLPSIFSRSDSKFFSKRKSQVGLA